MILLLWMKPANTSSSSTNVAAKLVTTGSRTAATSTGSRNA